jgi:hypothetical protein
MDNKNHHQQLNKVSFRLIYSQNELFHLLPGRPTFCFPAGSHATKNKLCYVTLRRFENQVIVVLQFNVSSTVTCSSVI